MLKYGGSVLVLQGNRIVKTDDNHYRRARAKVKQVNITVSIVEDDAPARGILTEWIRGANGFKCVGTHENAETALAALPQENPSVVLMDINMPGMNGIECVRRRTPQMVKGMGIQSAIDAGNREHPGEALKPKPNQWTDLAARYDYLLQRNEILKKSGIKK